MRVLVRSRIARCLPSRLNLTISLGRVDPSTCPVPEVETTIENIGSAPASNIVVRYWAGDPHQGGTVLHETTKPGPIPAGGSETFMESIPNFPKYTPILIYGWVDPDNLIQECNDGNNIDKADNKVECGEVGPV
ncbi:MAG: hypothetical protein GY847_18850 [Proteobacteria bacterium]|nr:hypothetical protein [Pseudomonadota bacterium]